jgi:hypothetical protein
MPRWVMVGMNAAEGDQTEHVSHCVAWRLECLGSVAIPTLKTGVITEGSVSGDI